MAKYDNNDISCNEIEASIAAGAAISGTHLVPAVEPGNGGPYAVVPDGYKIEDLESYLPCPLRVRQTVEVHDADSFIAYLKEYAKRTVSHVFFRGDKDAEQFVAIIDYHDAAGDPGWCSHLVRYACRRSVEFQTWMASNRRSMSQVDFARFLEENLPDIVEPNSADLLEMALTFQAQKDVSYSSGVRLRNGQVQFQYDEIVRGQAAKNSIEAPEQFVLGIAIHENGPAYRIPVRLRWRLTEGKLSFWYEIVRPHKFIADAVAAIRTKVTSETGLPVLTGVAE